MHVLQGPKYPLCFCFLLVVVKITISKNEYTRMKWCISINLTIRKIICEKYDEGGDTLPIAGLKCQYVRKMQYNFLHVISTFGEFELIDKSNYRRTITS